MISTYETLAKSGGNIEMRYYQNVDSGQSEIYDTLDIENDSVIQESGGQDINSKVKTKDECKPQLKLNPKTILFRVSVVASFAILVIVLAVLIVLYVISRHSEEKQCVKRDDIPNGKIINSTGSNHGDSMHIECKTGSELVGSSVITCLSSDKWSDNPRCILRQCKAFVMPEHAIDILNITSEVGRKIQIDCQKGFSLQGNKSVVCKNNEKWSESPVCEPINCGEPINVTNGLYQRISGTIFTDTIDVECSGGYKLIGEATIKCQADKKWSSLPVCQPVSCGIPNIPENGHLKTIHGTTFGETAILECDEGYIKIGDSNVTCMADGSWNTGPTCSLASDCYSIRTLNITLPSGIYIVTLWKSKQNIQVYCDMETDGGGWTVFQNRFNGSVDFYKTFDEYVKGFGNVHGECWLGLNFIDEMVSQNQTELRIDIQAADGDTAYENHQNFYLDKESNFMLHVDLGIGTAGDEGMGLSFNSGKQFTTHDQGVQIAFAIAYHGAWWYSTGSYLNLNGEYLTPGSVSQVDQRRGMQYRKFKGLESLKASKMMFRRTRG